MRGFAAVVPSDPNHGQAVAWLAVNREPLITSDYVVDETLTLLRARGERMRAVLLGKQFFVSAVAQIHFLTESELRSAWETFQKYDDKNWSFTDCSSKVVIEQLGITEAFAFDHHFHQFGKVQVVP